ncbi:MAG TPA: DNA translocase FtsK, partial [Firmicutes bacterium]|nr:DNA translocase FtsK [Bacillota bacterium]
MGGEGANHLAGEGETEKAVGKEASKNDKAGDGRQRDPLWYELWGIVVAAAGILILLSLHAANLMGPVGRGVKQALRVALGDAAWGPGLACLLLGMGMVWRHRGFAGGRRWTGALGLLLVGAGAVHGWALANHLITEEWTAARQGMGGGVIGLLVWSGLTRAFGVVGAWVVGVAAALVSTLLFTHATFRGLVRYALAVGRGTIRAWRWAGSGLRRVFFVEVSVEEGGEEEEPEGEEPGAEVASAAYPQGVQAVPAGSPAHLPPADPSGGEATCAGSAVYPSATAPGPMAGQVVTAAKAAVRPTPAKSAGPEQLRLDAQLYQLPSLTLLARSPKQRLSRGEREVADKARLIEETLASFGVEAKVVEASKGPTVTRFEVHPGPGVKVSRITALADDIALSLAAADVRIEPRIPGKSAVGIEVPNREISMVTLREVLETAEFRDAPSLLSVGLGKDVAGRPVIPSLDSLPHILIAGATGSGKSVCLNCIICSILFKARPHEVKFLLIDPKVVELSVFDGIPHLLAPVVADPRKAAGVLRWLVEEMVQRWRLFADVGVRDIARYNAAMVKAESPTDALPFIVVVIDELADLMTVAPVELEEAVQRLAQMGRAAGIHLVMATQRPSTDVITGTIKANIPSRLAFAVASQVDSRIVLDMPGAERLVGRGDMLFLPLGSSKPIRAQGAYVSEAEIEE